MATSLRPIAIFSAVAWSLLAAEMVRATGKVSEVINDPPNDAMIRLTDEGGNGPCSPESQGIPDLAQIRMGRFAPATPNVDLFAGSWSASGGYLRFEVIFSGLVNPPGPVGYDKNYPTYAPFQYGPNPVFGWIEMDVDQDENTGGELATPQFRYLGNVARFGGKPRGAKFANRVAESDAAFDDNVLTAPFVDRSGEEFHLAFIAESITQITVIQERTGGNPAVFEPGETWRVQGRLFHRAHGFEEFAFMCPTSEGEYMPLVTLQFSHEAASNRTTVSLVFPLTNAACAAMQGPGVTVEEEDGCSGNQFSIEEALEDLKFSATFAGFYDRLNPRFQLLADWQFNNVSSSLSPAAWRVLALVGTAYAEPKPDSDNYIWTDVWPNPLRGDFNGDGAADGLDSALFYNYVGSHDGVPGCDDDNDSSNERITLHDFARDFSMYDVDQDGIVQSNDLVLMGDMNLDGQFSYGDVADFVMGIVNPAAYQSSHQGIDPSVHGDMNGDTRLDGQDVRAFTEGLVDQSSQRVGH